jgi:hypothetical protein
MWFTAVQINMILNLSHITSHFSLRGHVCNCLRAKLFNAEYILHVFYGLYENFTYLFDSLAVAIKLKAKHKFLLITMMLLAFYKQVQ